MGKCTAAQAVSAFAYWLGYCEKATKTYADRREKEYFEKDRGSNNYTYPGHLCGVQGGAWCAMMVSTAIHEACGGKTSDARAVLHGVWPYTACDQLYDAAPAGSKGRRGKWSPKAGDVIVFTDDGSTRTHTGMVYAADGTTVYTYEGNSANMCRKRSYLLTSSYIYGYVRPAYAGGEPAAIQGEKYGKALSVGLHELSMGCAGPEVMAMQCLLAGNGAKDDAGAVIEPDGDFGKRTKQGLIRSQKSLGLTADGVCGAKTWIKLLTGNS